MPLTPRVLDDQPVTSVEDYIAAGGGRGLQAARDSGGSGIIDMIEESGLRGRGGAGFPTGSKWRTVAANRSPLLAATVVVNAAEGEPGSFKDRALLRANPYRVIEGALVAAVAVGADAMILATKASFAPELERVRAAIDEMEGEGWTEGIDVYVVEGPSHYLYGEETALLEVIDGRNPFPRITPPYRRGVDESGTTASPAHSIMAGPRSDAMAAPTLVNNAETMAHVATIVAEGPAWFRSLGTQKSPGTIVCTVTGATTSHGVGEFPMGTPLREILDTIGGGPPPGRRVVAVMSGVANPLLPEHMLDTPASFEAMEAVGSGLGAAGFIVFDDTVDLAAVALGVSRFLSVESCGQCTPCKQDGLSIAGVLERVCRSEPDGGEMAALEDLLQTVANESRCYLATQHERVVGSVLSIFPEALTAHLDGGSAPVEAELVAPITDLANGRALLDEKQISKQPDWTFGPTDSGQSPADMVESGTDLV